MGIHLKTQVIKWRTWLINNFLCILFFYVLLAIMFISHIFGFVWCTALQNFIVRLITHQLFSSISHVNAVQILEKPLCHPFVHLPHIMQTPPISRALWHQYNMANIWYHIVVTNFAIIWPSWNRARMLLHRSWHVCSIFHIVHVRMWMWMWMWILAWFRRYWNAFNMITTVSLLFCVAVTATTISHQIKSILWRNTMEHNN